MAPKAVRNQAMTRGSDGRLRLEIVDAGREFVLDPLAELIWVLCDGSRDIEALAQAAGQAFDRVVQKEEVFSALDFLADASLIEERVAPPVAEGNVSRRSLLSRIAPVVGAAAWMMSGAAARAGGLIQYNESASKENSSKGSARESSNKESSRKGSAQESSTKERSSKSADSESDDKKRDSKESDNKEQDHKNRDSQSDDKQDGQQDPEERRQAAIKKQLDEIKELERKTIQTLQEIVRLGELEKKMRASWPSVYELVGHKLSEFRELRVLWEGNAWLYASRLNANNHNWIFQTMQSAFGKDVQESLATLAPFWNAGFLLPDDSPNWPPFLAGDSQRKTYLILQQLADPAKGDNWRLAINSDNLRFEFNDEQAAYQFLSNRNPPISF